MQTQNNSFNFTTLKPGHLLITGTGVLSAEDTGAFREYREGWTDTVETVETGEGITGIGEGFLEVFANLRCVILSRSVVSVEGAAGRELMVRGEFDTFAEEFAGANGLVFLHRDIPVAEDEAHGERDEITLRFHAGAAPDILHDVYACGSSAGSYGGGQVVNELPDDFYKGCTIEGFAANFPERLHDRILGNEMLIRYLAKANERPGVS